jgi:hypothetical protein
MGLAAAMPDAEEIMEDAGV